MLPLRGENRFAKATCLHPRLFSVEDEALLSWWSDRFMVQSLQAISSLLAGESKARFPDGIGTEIIQFVLSDCILPQAVFFFLFNFFLRVSLTCEIRVAQAQQTGSHSVRGDCCTVRRLTVKVHLTILIVNNIFILSTKITYLILNQ